ncbi:LEM protein 2-like isoform X2 [Actinia tenebrosa]|uniref:LEM protein 2-like isoform X2 n=1 Tax=Actinia tenebrosa TaxID=6105 RepID=A0A6P8IGL6_ACTTE|nr:LEM protein 2-like isoform X2 [Actinia tenebrosa]
MDSSSEEKKEKKKVSKRKTVLRAIFEYLKKPPQKPQKILIRKPVKGLPYDVNSLSDGDLARQLRSYGQVVGPITETTRPLYQKKLIKLLQDEMKNPASVQPVDKTPKAWEYSDNEDEVPNRTFEVKKEKEDKHVVNIQDDVKVDASPELPPPQLSHPTKERPLPPRESTPKKVIKRETMVSESHMETRKRVFESDKKPLKETTVKKSSSPTTTTKMSGSTKTGASWEWKAVLVVLALITIILLVYYFMEESREKPASITSQTG